MEFRIIEKPRRLKQGTEMLALALRKSEKGDRVFIEKWNNWPHSFWVKIRQHGKEVIVDSGLIEDLAERIRRIKKFGFDEKRVG